ncbi:carbon storage regulator CsrA [Paenibacillus sp. JSM ZJ436]|uniref:carbon storage regulator CsrA n=1 Tax=Paenibacillus sp. JSM ZJ436 TaxID=3376190 RepID=UPI0037AD7DB0
MLVLSRKVGESIVIQDEIEVTVLAVEGDTVRIGIQAPKSVGIYRKEVYATIQESNRNSIADQDSSLSSLKEWLSMNSNNKK